MDKINSCCFFGHRNITETDELKNKVRMLVEKLIVTHNITYFYFGSRSKFNDLCLNAVTALKKTYPHIRRIYVRAEFPYIDDSYKSYLLQDYDDTYYPEDIIKSGKGAYIKRNQKMIDNSNFCVVYYDENYLPPKRKKSKADLTDYQPQSGTKLAYEYAVKKGRFIYNINEII